MAVFCVFQEMLTNVTRHAKATEVKVGLREEDDRLVFNGTEALFY